MDMNTQPSNSAINDPAKRGDKGFPLPNAMQLFLVLQFSVKTPRRKAIHPSRKRRRAETIAPNYPL
jgi:hypothetical protein